MRIRIEMAVTPDTNTWANMQCVVGEFFDQLRGRYGSQSPVEHTMARVFRDQCGGVIGRMDVLDGDVAQPVPHPRPYSYEEACEVLRSALADLETIEGARVGHSGASWQDHAGTAAVSLRILAGMLDAAREGRVTGSAVFPSVEEELENSRKAV